MISAHTPPGTRVVQYVKERMSGYRVAHINTVGCVLTITRIKPCTFIKSGYLAFVEENEAGYCINLLRRLDLPSCLTDLLQSNPVDALVGLSASPDLHPHSTPANNGLDRPRDVHCKPTADGLCRVMRQPSASLLPVSQSAAPASR